MTTDPIVLPPALTGPPPVQPGDAPLFTTAGVYDWSVPTVQSGPVAYSGPVPSTDSYSSNLHEMLMAAGMLQPPASYTPPRGPMDPNAVPYVPSQSYAPAGGITEQFYQDPTRIVGNQKDAGSNRVYMGHERSVTTRDEDNVKPTVTSETPSSITVTQAANLPYVWYSDKKKLNRLETALRKAGYKLGTNSGSVFTDAVTAWGQAVNTAANIYAASGGKTLVTPWDVLSQRSKEQPGGGAGGSTTHTTTQINKLSEGEAWQMARSVVQQTLGRDPTDQEVRDFLSMANNDAAKDPQTTSTTSTTNAKTGRTSSSTTVDPGYTSADAQEALYKQEHNTADYAAYQSAGTIFNWIQAALAEVA